MEQTSFVKTTKKFIATVAKWSNEYKRTKRTAFLILCDGKEYVIASNISENGVVKKQQFINIVEILSREPELRAQVRNFVRQAERIATKRARKGVKS